MENKKHPKTLDDITSLIKLLSLFFPGIAVYQYLNHAYMDDPNLMMYMTLLSFMVFTFVYLIWSKIDKTFTSLTLGGKGYYLFSMVVSSFCIILTGGCISPYKFIFLFLIISFTIEAGLNQGVIIASICSAFILILRLPNPHGISSISTLESDLILVLMFLTIAWVIGYYVRIEQENISILQDAVNIDGLTKLYNHHFFHSTLEDLLAQCKQDCMPIAVILLDIDYFKVYNDIHGHLQGDNALRLVANIIKQTELPHQVTARYGGEEFGIILPNTSLVKAQEHAESIRKHIQDTPFYGQEYLPNENLTVSIGVAINTENDSCYKLDLVDQADKALYQAKFLHKNSVKTYKSLLDQYTTDDKEVIASIKTLVAVINSRDTITFSHVERVVYYADRLATTLNLTEKDRRTLIYGAYMHDIGKINIPTEILNKSTKLTTDEWEVLKTHPTQGIEVIKRSPNFDHVRTLVIQHHEKFDGSGYPQGLKGTEIDYLSRLLTIIDSFDAMTSQRPYQVSKTFEQGYAELRRCAGTQFDPELVEIFIATMKQENSNNR